MCKVILLKVGITSISTAHLMWLYVAFIVAIAVTPDCLFAEECKVIDYIDHVELVCVGSPSKNTTILTNVLPIQQVLVQDSSDKVIQQPTQDQDVKPNGAQVSKKRKQLETIRDLNIHRFDSVR